MGQSLPTDALLSLQSALRQVMAVEAGKAAVVLIVADQAAFEAAVLRHRLAVVLAPHAELLGLPAATAALVKREARQAQMAAMPLIALAREAMAALPAAGVPFLVIKGPALAVQTTGQDTYRGSGDLDLFVAPGDLAAARKALEAIGFHQAFRDFPRDLNAMGGRYGRWVTNELSLLRGNQMIDLHWSLTASRLPLPSFPAAWQERQWVTLGKEACPTLSLRHAFLFACAHAAKDDWMTLRSLVDIDRLARTLPLAEQARLRQLTCVRLSCAATYQATNSPHLLAFFDPARPDCKWAAQRARSAQVRTDQEEDGPWRPWHRIGSLHHRLARLSPSPMDWLRRAAVRIASPGDFIDPVTGQDLGLAGMVRVRLWQRQSRRTPHFGDPR